MSPIQRLPLELMVLILQQLTPSEVAGIARTCHFFSSAATLCFASLRSFHLTHFHTNEHLPALIKRCPRLQYVNTYHSQVDRDGYQLLSQGLPCLTELRISEKHQNAKATFEDPKVARLVKRLFVIPGGNGGGGDAPEAEPDRVGLQDLPRCTGVAELTIYRFVMREPLVLGNPPTNLRLLMCSFQLLPGVAPFREADLAGLQKLNLHSCREFQAPWLDQFMACARLEELNVHNIALSDSFLQLAHFPLLRSIHFGAPVVASAASMAQFVRRHLPHLVALSLVQVGDTLVEHLGDLNTNLTYLSLEGAAAIPLSRRRLLPFLLRFERLTRLEFTAIRGIPSLLCKTPFFRQLEVVELSKAPDFQARDTERVLAALPRLRLLTLHLPDAELPGAMRVASASLQSFSLRVRQLEALELGECPSLHSVLGKFPDSLENSGSLFRFSVTGRCPSLRMAILPSNPLDPLESLWTPLFSAFKANLAANLIGLDCAYHPSLPALVRDLRVPYVMCYNCTDSSFAFLETFCSLSEQPGGKPCEILEAGNSFGQTEVVRRERVAYFRTLTDNRWVTEHFATNVRAFADLLRDLERQCFFNVTADNHTIYNFLRTGLRRKRFLMVSLTGVAENNSPFM